MKFSQFENIISSQRMNRYLIACGNDTKKSMTLYRLNLRLSQEFYTIISCFEVALRNAINKNCTEKWKNDWLRESAKPNGIFIQNKCEFTAKMINDAIKILNEYSHYKLITELGFGFWRYMFAPRQYHATKISLAKIFPLKPKSIASKHYNNDYIYDQLEKIN